MAYAMPTELAEILDEIFPPGRGHGGPPGTASRADFEVFAEQNPALLDKRLLQRHYTAATLASPPARSGWVEPDVAAFPWSSASRP